MQSLPARGPLLAGELALAQEDKHAREAEEGEGFGEGVDEIFAHCL